MRRATVRTDHADGETARALARAVAPDNTAEMHTDIEGTTVETTIERETTGGLHATIDDYVVNLTVAAQCANEDADASTTTTNDT